MADGNSSAGLLVMDEDNKDDADIIFEGSEPTSLKVPKLALNANARGVTILPVGARVYFAMDDPTTGHLDKNDCPTNAVGTELLGSLVVFVTVKHAVESPVEKVVF